MKNIALLLFSLLSVTGCSNQIDVLISSFRMDDIDFSIPSTTNSTQFINIEVLSNFPNNDFDAEATVVPTEASLNALVENMDYDFIEQISVRICASGEASDENCGIKIFERKAIPLSSNSLELNPIDFGIRYYLSREKVYIQVVIERLPQSQPQPVESRLSLNFDVKFLS